MGEGRGLAVNLHAPVRQHGHLVAHGPVHKAVVVLIGQDDAHVHAAQDRAYQLAVQAVRRRCARALFIVIGYLAQLVPWFFIGRITFAYHYFPSVLFLILALCYVFYSLSEQEELIAWKPAMYAVTAGAAALYALFYPVLVGIQIPSWYGTCLLRWLPSWPF